MDSSDFLAGLYRGFGSESHPDEGYPAFLYGKDIT
jgi:hypothetical protein